MGGVDKICLFYASRNGQSRRIAERLAQQLAEKGISAIPRDLKIDFPSIEQISQSRLLIVIASIRYGFHLPEATRLLRAYNKIFIGMKNCKLAVVSVNLTARKPGKDTAEGNYYLRKWLSRNKLKPTIAVPIAGSLEYPHYNWFDKFMIRLIMTITGGPTDPTKVTEFTQWDRIDNLAIRIAEEAI